MSAITYVLQMDGPGLLVKFGKTNSPKSRIASLQTGVPWSLGVVALIGHDCEAAMKRQFAEHKVKGEWFRPCAELQSFLDGLADEGKLVKQVAVDGAYMNAVIKPRIREYLENRDPNNNPHGDLVCRVLADMLPTMTGRESSLVSATKGHVTQALCRGFGPTLDRPVVRLDVASAVQAAA